MEEHGPRPEITHVSEAKPLIPSAEKIASCDDLLIEILTLLPIKSLLQFKCVSKHWFFLINSPHFSRKRYPHTYNRPAGLFVYPFRLDGLIISDPDFISLETSTPCPNMSGMDILHSCNGLLTTYRKMDENEYKYYVCNPTTRTFIDLPQPGEQCSGFVEGLYIAFEPQKSPYYKVIGVWKCNRGVDSTVRIRVFSSEFKSWNDSIVVNGTIDNVDFRSGVYWNGSINWTSHEENSFYFHIEEERLIEFPMIPTRDHCGRPFEYFGVSSGHLHLIEIYGERKTRFNVYEMKMDYSEWFVLYCVDLDGVRPRLFPDHTISGSVLDRTDDCNSEFKVLALVREEKNEDSFMVLHVPGKIIRYQFYKKSFLTVQTIEGDVHELFPWHGALGFIDSPSFEYIESLSHV